MTNGERYKTAEERNKVFSSFCKAGDNGCKKCQLKAESMDHCSFLWLELEAEEEKPMPCPYCGKLCGVSYMPDGDEESGDENAYAVMCENCGYHSAWGDTRDAVVTVHNRICKAVDAYNESEVTNG